MWTGIRINSHKESNSTPFPNSIGIQINAAVGEGFKECFKVTARGLYAISNSRYYRPEQVQIVRFQRFDNVANPSDNATLYLLETSDGCKGTLIDTFGRAADEHLHTFIAQVEEIRRKLSRHQRPEC